MKKKKIIDKTFLILISIVILIFLIKNFSKNNQFYDILFLKLFPTNSKINVKNQNLKSNQYIFDISYKNTRLKDVSLIQSANTMVYEKIAPGTCGNFSIVLRSNKKSKYFIKFKSENEKPTNLKFSAYSDGEVISSNKNNLDELEDDLVGVLEKNQIKVIVINWAWDYETDEINSIQDTQDSKKIKQYKFNIYAEGQEI